MKEFWRAFGDMGRLNQAFLVSLALFLLAAVLDITTRDMRFTPDTYDEIAAQLNALEVRKLNAQTRNPNANTVDLDSKIGPLKAKLAQLEPAHQAELTRRVDEKRRQEQAVENKRLKEAERELAAFNERCEAVRSKKFVDLTVNDIQFLKECGTPAPYIPGMPSLK